MDAMSCLVPLSDAAIARALHFSSSTTIMSVSPGSSSSSSSSLSQSHHHSSPLVPSAYYAPPAPVPPPHDSVLVADSPTHHRNHALAPRAVPGKNKRRSRASKRAPTTYITTDPANFRLMVQQVTGVQPADTDVPGLGLLQVQAAALFGAAAGNPPLLLPPGDDDDDASALRQHQLQQPCFPTLDSSWNVVMYDTNSAEMLL